ncbi:MAG: T9SS type A sorting domain-containing protein [Bacteroidia bacterium]
MSNVYVSAQVGLKPLLSNPTIQNYLNQNPDYIWNQSKKHNKWGTPDTLQIPFFEDFTSTLIYPDSSKWQNNYVYINRDFAINPPSYGVATFDYLNQNGLPYSSIEKETVDYGDTLTSQFINLKDSNGISYLISDSFYLSFFYQPRGRGDFITSEDSLKLLFKDADGNWVKVWGVNGGSNYDFKQVLIPLKNAKYLHETFQFMFVNLTHRWGNNNHWHLDYIYLNKNRSVNDRNYRDYAIQSPPTSLLKHYYSMPYDHFLADKSEAADSFYFTVSNMQGSVINAQVRYVETNMGNVLKETQFVDNAANVPANGWSLRKVPGYDFSNLNGYPVVIGRNYMIRESGITNPVLFQTNDTLTQQFAFTRHYAYDDGTAESGFGFNDLKNAEGEIVVEFDLKKADSLQAVDILLTYNTADVSNQRFDFRVYGDIALNGGTDNLLFERRYSVSTIYKNSDARNFYTISLDTPIYLPAGKFYVGWSQDRNYNLTVGFDKNNGYLKDANKMNDKIYFNVGDGWVKNNNPALVGAPMIRPIVGQSNPWLASVEGNKTHTLKCYPNPATDELFFNETVEKAIITDILGNIVLEQNIENNSLIISQLNSGIYFVSVLSKQNEWLTAKVIKL